MPTDSKPPTARKYEVGTAQDYTRVYRDFKDGSVFSLDEQPSVRDLDSMFRNDAQARQIFSAIKLPIRRSTADVMPGEGDTGEQKFVEHALFAPARQGGMTTPFRLVVGEMANAMGYRFAPFEKVWKVQDRDPYAGYFVLHKLGYRPPATCRLRTDDNGSFNGFVQEAVKGNKYRRNVFDPKRSLVYIHGNDEAPQIGMTPFDVVYKMYINKLKVSFFYYAFLENVAFPRTLAKVAGDDPEELGHLLDKARQFASRGVLGLYDHETLETYESQRNTRDYQSALEYLDWQMAKAFIAQFLDLGTSGERGSYALSRDKSSFFFTMLEAVLDDIADTINNYLVADLVEYNFGRKAIFPKVRFRPLNDESADATLETYRNIILANAPNVTPPFLLRLMTRVSEILGLEMDPMMEYDEDVLREIRETIPTARESLESKEARAGSGQNPITGRDRNENNNTPQSEEPGKLDQIGRERSDEESIKRQGPARTPSRRRRKYEEDD